MSVTELTVNTTNEILSLYTIGELPDCASAPGAFILPSSSSL